MLPVFLQSGPICMDQSLSRKIIKFVLLFIFLMVCWQAGQHYDINLEEVQQKFRGYSMAASGVIFIGTYVVLTNLVWFGPKDILRTAAALIFGGAVSTVFVVIGEMVNAAVLFHLSRFFGREYVERQLGKGKTNLDKITRNRSALGVFTVRINLLIPIRFTDLGYGLTGIPFRKYFTPAMLALIPRVFWQQYFLATGGVAVLESMSKLLSGDSRAVTVLFEPSAENPLYSYYLENTLFWICTLCYILLIVVLTLLVSSRKLMELMERRDAPDGRRSN